MVSPQAEIISQQYKLYGFYIFIVFFSICLHGIKKGLKKEEEEEQDLRILQKYISVSSENRNGWMVRWAMYSLEGGLICFVK